MIFKKNVAQAIQTLHLLNSHLRTAKDPLKLLSDQLDLNFAIISFG